MEGAVATVEKVISNMSIQVENILQLRREYITSTIGISELKRNLELIDNSAGISDDQKNEKRSVVLWIAGQYKSVIKELTGSNLSPLTRLVLAHSFLCSSEYKKAAETLLPLRDSKEPFVQAVLVDALIGNEDYEEAAKVVATLEGHSDKYARYATARLAEMNHSFDQASSIYEQLVAEDRDFHLASFRLAGIYDMFNQNSAAVNMYLKSVPYGFTPIASLVNLGLLLEDDEHYSKAISCFRRAYEMDPTNNIVRLHLENSQGSQNMIFDEKKDQERKATEKILNVPVSDFELSVRSRNCLSKMNIMTLGDLVNRSEEDLLSYKNFGETSLKEIKEMLNQRGLALKSNKEEKKEGEEDDEPSEESLALLKAAQGISIDSVQLSLRSRKCLERLGIKTLEEITRYSRDDLMTIRNFGQTSFDEIIAVLAENNLFLKH